MGAVELNQEDTSTNQSAQPVRVLLVDDELLVRAGLRMVLSGSPGITVVGEAGDGLAGAQAAAALRPDVVLMDVRMKGMDGIEATRRIVEGGCACAVVVLTAFDTESFVADALAAGAQGFLLKSAPPSEIIDAVLAAARGEMPFTPEVLRRIATLAARSSQPSGLVDALASLSERELEVAMLVADGLANAEIAAELHLSLATVKTYLNRIFDKTGCGSRVPLALLVERGRVAGAVPR